MRLWEAALLTIVAVTVLTVLAGVPMFYLSVAEGILAGLMISMPGVFLGSGIFRLVRGPAVRYPWICALSGLLGCMASVLVYWALFSLATRGYNHSSAAVAAAAMVWLSASSPIALVIGAAFGAGWGQRRDSR